MESPGGSVTNATLTLVREMEAYFEQSENMATAEIGVAIGVVVSLGIMLGLCCSANVLISAKQGGSPVVACCKPRPGAVGTENASSALGTEGAYRSDSDSDDEGEGAKVALEAQMRSRCASGV